MSDDLVERLRDWENVWPKDADKPAGSLYLTAADRIEELEAENKRLRDEYRYIGKDGKPILARELEDQRDEAREKLAEEIRISNERGNYIEFTLTPQLADAEAQNEALKAKLAMAVEALEDNDRVLQILAHHNGLYYPKHKYRVEKQIEANISTIAELTGDTNG